MDGSADVPWTRPRWWVRAIASVPRDLEQQHRTEVLIQRIRYFAALLALALTLALGGGPQGRLWLAVAAMTLSVVTAELLLRRPPTVRSVRAAGLLSFGLDLVGTSVTLLTISQDPADPVVILALVVALEAAVRWQVAGALLGAALGVPLVLLWRLLAHEHATGAPPPVEYLVFQATVLTLLVILVGAMVRRAEHERHRAQEVLLHAPELIVTLDRAGRITSANAAARTLLGRAPDDLLGQRWQALVDDIAPIGDASTPSGEGRSLQQVRRTDGSTAWLEVSVREEPVTGMRTLVARDVTARIRTDRQLAVSEQRLRALFDNNLDAVFGFDIDGRLVEVNPAAERLFLRPRAELLHLHGLDLIEPDHRDEARIGLGRALGGDAINLEVLVVHPGGTTVHADTDLIPIVIDGQVVGVFGMARDVTERKRRETYLEYRVHHDLLTGLPNRASLLQAARRHQEAGETIGLLFLDLDGFKQVNDTLGHAIGDQVLVAVARRLQGAVRDQDLVCRLAGDEFCILLTSADPTKLQAVGERAGRSIGEVLHLEDADVRVGASIGAALARPREDIQALLARADAAMYTVKQHRQLGDQGDPAPLVLLAL
jgi:diguanylate cyclase (GGDEF)-like protein/PAS domain S-box-containing protein